MAEWLKRGTVNTLFRGSNPLKTYNTYLIYKLKKKIRYIYNPYLKFIKKIIYTKIFT